MVLDYSLKVFLIIFFSLIGAAIVFAVPLVVVLIMHLAKEDGFKATGCLSMVVSLCTSIAIILFCLAWLVLSTFSYVPWWASALIITGFIILVVIALKPWRKTEWGFTYWFMIGLIILLLAVSWVGCWLSHGICFTSAPSSYTFYIDRYTEGDLCAKSGNKPCHTYLTFNTNASTDVIVHFHSSKLYSDPKVFVGTAAGVYSQIFVATSHKLDMITERDRWIYYGFLRNLQPNSTYYFTAGDGNNPAADSFTPEKKFRTAPASGDVPFVTGGDMGITEVAKTLLKNAAAREPTYIALGGDLAYANGLAACYPRWDKFLTNLEENAVTPTGYTVPFIMAAGNHEAGGWEQPLKNMRFYTRYFVHENLAGRAARNLPLHHVHYIGDSVLVSLDSHVIETPASQKDWLTNILSTAPAGSLKMAMYHAPGYPSVRPMSNTESTGVRTNFVPIFQDHGLTVSFENHDHAYKRTKLLINDVENPGGVLYVGDGAMGVKPRATVSISGRDYLEKLEAKNFYIHVTPNTSNQTAALDVYDQEETRFDQTIVNYR